MSRQEFLTELESLLMGISEEERKEALNYYENYFEDAGQENEAQVMEELGSPEKVAAMIKADLKGDNTDCGEFTECGYTDERYEEKESPACRDEARESGKRYSYYRRDEQYAYGEDADRSSGETAEYHSTGKTSPRTSRWLKVLLIALILIVAVPSVFPILIAVSAVLLGLLCAVFGIFAGLVIGALAVTFAGLIIVLVGMAKLLTITPSAVLTVGMGLLVMVLGLIATAATAKLCLIVYPSMFRRIVKICRKPFHRKVVS